MTEPGEGIPQKQPVTPEMPTGVIRSIEQLDALNANRLEPLPPVLEPLPEAPPYKKDRLFSRKVMIGWAVATLLVWFALTFITPIIAETVKAEIMSRMEPPTTNTATPVVAPVPPIESCICKASIINGSAAARLLVPAAAAPARRNASTSSALRSGCRR